MLSGTALKKAPEQVKQFTHHIFQKPWFWLAAALFFYLFALLFGNKVSQPATVQDEKQKLEEWIHKQEKDFEKLVSDTSLLYRLASRSESVTELKNLAKNISGIFIYSYSLSYPELIFWSNQYFLPPDTILIKPDGEYFEKLDNGFYLYVKKTIHSKKQEDTLLKIPGDSLLVAGLIPVQTDYYVDTKYLPNSFAFNKTAISKIRIADTASVFPVTNLSGQIMFYLEPKFQSINQKDSAAGISLKILSVIFLFVFFQLLVNQLKRRYGFTLAFISLILLLSVFRFITYITDFPFWLRQFGLFDPSVYGSNPVHKSLGDLLINSLFFFWITFFAWQNICKPGKKIFPAINKWSNAWRVVFIFVIPAFTLMLSYTVRGLAADSDISFDVIDFFSLSQYTVYGFTALSVLAIGYYFFMRIIVQALSELFPEKFYTVYLFISLVVLTWLTVSIKNPLLGFYMKTLGWLLFYIWLMRLNRFAINRTRMDMGGTLFWIFLFSSSITAIIIEANKEKEWEQRKKMADSIALLSDPYNERELSISLTYLDEDFLEANFVRFREEYTAQELRDSILRESGYLSRYNTRLYIFDKNNKPLFNEEAESFNALNTILRLQAKPTHAPHLYYYETSFDRYTYIFKREARDTSGKYLGSVFILSDPEQYSTEALYPELFRRPNQELPDENPVYAYAVYTNGLLESNPSVKYSFPTILLPDEYPVKRYAEKRRENYSELWYWASNEKVIVIVRKSTSVIEAITLFSYIFCAFLVLVGFFWLFALLLHLAGRLRDVRALLQWNIRTQVHSTIILISILSFVIIGVATISFFIKRYEENNREKLGRTMEIVVKEMQKKLDKQQVFDDQIAIYDSVANEDVQKLVNEIAEFHNVEVNVYDTLGNLHVTSQPIIYREGYLSKKIHPVAFYNLNRLRQVRFTQQEKLSALTYMSIYAPLRSEGMAYAYLNIPYFFSQRELKPEISNFLVTIINLNAFIFLIAGVIALFITNRVTRSFSLISEKMRDVNLGRANEEIEWNRDDEIGGLVREYNKMVKKLEVSAGALARSEREGAWREMARQVAHEIKNPLTPMKLSIQYLQKSINSNSGNVKELTANVAKTLVEQIDHLSKIAFDFSQFANIGNTHPEKYDLREVLQSLAELYRVNDNVDIEMLNLDEEIMVYSDKTQMNRLFTNLLQNAVEAGNGQENRRIAIQAVKEPGKVIVSVQDNGEGVPEEMKAKIFAPNFTTKSSGTGLGLAICRGIVEQAKGNIWFETSKGEGSTFFVELPLVN